MTEVRFRTVRFLGFVPDEDSLVMLQAFATWQGWPQSSVQRGTADDAVQYLATHPTPDFLLVDVPDAASAPAVLDKLADVCDPKVKVIVTSTVDEFSFFRWLTDIGVHSYLLKPIMPEAFGAALESGLAPKGETKIEEPETSLISVIGARGGVGTTSVALNLAASFALNKQQSTVLLDMEPQWGTISLMLDLDPGRGLREALAKPERIDSLFMERVLLKYNDHLSVLSSEEPLDEAVTIHADAAKTLLKESRKRFSMMVADVPAHIPAISQPLLTEAEHVLLVTDLSLIALRDAMRLSDYLREKIKVKQLHLIANRVGLTPKYDMPKADFEKSVGMPFTITIPFDGDAYGKMAGGELAVGPKFSTPFAKAYQTLAEKLSGTSEHNAKATGMLGWLKKKP